MRLYEWILYLLLYNHCFYLLNCTYSLFWWGFSFFFQWLYGRKGIRNEFCLEWGRGWAFASSSFCLSSPAYFIIIVHYVIYSFIHVPDLHFFSYSLYISYVNYMLINVNVYVNRASEPKSLGVSCQMLCHYVFILLSQVFI